MGWVLCFFLGGLIGYLSQQKRLQKLLVEAAELRAENSAFKGQQGFYERSKMEFEHLSYRILKENSKEFALNSQEKLEELLSPFKQKIDLFQSDLREMSKMGSNERLLLKYRLEDMLSSNQALAEETQRLSRVLKGDVKKQGTWGELVLQKVLEASGLQENREYTLQGAGLCLQGEEGRRMQPDVLIHLPDDKQIIIDSKMSYTHYDDYFNQDKEEERKESLKKLVLSLKEHVKELSAKKYQFAKPLKSPSFVLLFVPIEAVFSLVIEAEPALFEEAWKQSIIIVSPSNMLAILKTIESIWKVEHQNRNAQKIAEEGAALYDKFVDLLKDLEAMGKSLKHAEEAFDKVLHKVSSGRGNLIKKTEDLKQLGLKTKKQIPSDYLLEEEIAASHAGE